MVAVVEKLLLIVLFFQIIVDISSQGRYYIDIVVWKNNKGCWKSNKL